VESVENTLVGEVENGEMSRDSQLKAIFVR
jgi:hypothetical protein